MNAIPIVVKIWSGSELHDFHYISRSLPSLLGSRLPQNARVLIFNDCSTDLRIVPFLEQLAARDHRIEIINNDINKGPNWGQEDAFRYALEHYPGSPYYVTVDDDVIYNPDWFGRLLQARADTTSSGIDGIFTALNSPSRRAHARLVTRHGKYLIKWRQPALNWLIPREVFDRVGSFWDDGIAYDTAYARALRLHRIPIICITPSHVQNIGYIGAYSSPGTLLTGPDFVGEHGSSSQISRIPATTSYICRKFRRRLMERLLIGWEDVGPIRWGTDLLSEGMTLSSRSIAVFLTDQLLNLGWNHSEIEKRVEAISRISDINPFRFKRLHRYRNGSIRALEHGWAFMPSLRDCQQFKEIDRPPPPHELLHAILLQTRLFHDLGLVHNKIRPENVFLSSTCQIYLTWLGVETHPNLDLGESQDRTLRILSSFVDKRARWTIRERFAVNFLESMAPEVEGGEAASPQSDVYAAAATVLRAVGEPIATIDALRLRQQQWLSNIYPEMQGYCSKRLVNFLTKCLAHSPADRFSDAAAALAELKLAVC